MVRMVPRSASSVSGPAGYTSPMELIGIILVVLAILAFIKVITLAAGVAVVLLVIGLVLLFAGYGVAGGRYGVFRRRP